VREGETEAKKEAFTEADRDRWENGKATDCAPQMGGKGFEDGSCSSQHSQVQPSLAEQAGQREVGTGERT
jgi:hypothetical protein